MIQALGKEVEILHHDAYKVDIGLLQPMQLPFAQIDSRPSGVVRLDMIVDGVRSLGMGEGTTLPYAVYTDDSGDNIARNCDELASKIQSNTLPCREIIEALQAHKFADSRVYPTARLAVEMALLDGYARSLGLSMARLMGTGDVVSVPFGKSIGALQTNDMVWQAQESIENGAKKIKLKVSPGNFKEVIAAIHVIRKQEKHVELMIDANGSFDPDTQEDIQAIMELDSLGLSMLEEPVSRAGRVVGVDAVRLLRDRQPLLITPICLDDCLNTYRTCKDSLDNGLADIINIKPGRIGSFVRSVELIDYAADIGKQVMVGGMFESTPGRCMTLQLGAYCLKKGFTIPGDLSLAQERLVGDLVDEHRQLRLAANGTIIMPTGLGWGF